MSPSLYDNYPLVTLPRIPDVDVSKKVFVAPITSADSSHIDLAISKSIVASYIIKPSPKLTWSFALSPSTVVDSIEVSEVENGSKIYFVGITERKKHRIMVINRQSDDATKETVEVPHRVVGIKHIENSGRYSVVYDNGGVEIFTYEDSTVKSINSALASSRGHLIYHSFISKSEYPNSEGLVLLAVRYSKYVHFKLVSLNVNEPFEINSAKSQGESEAKYTYNSGILYQFENESKRLSSISIADFSTTKSIDISTIVGNVSIDDISLDSPSPERLIVGVRQQLYLLSFKYESVLARFHDTDNLCLASVVRVNGSSMNTSKSFALYLSSEIKNNNHNLNLINVDVGLNKLSESLGRSITKKSNDDFKGLPDLSSDSIEKDSKSLSIELREVFDTLKKCAASNDVEKWERILVPYLKNESWSSISKSLTAKKQKKATLYEFKVFEVEKDRSIDPNFVQRVLSLIFDGESSLSFLNDEFVPEYTLVYLLTNPLFPYKYTKGLLGLLQQSNLDTLLRQAITTCPNLEIEDLLLQLAVEENSLETFNELVDRLVNDFSTSQITNGLRDLFSQKNDLNLDWIINNLLKTDSNNSWNICSCILDVGGLFRWSLDTVNALDTLVESKMNSLIQNSYNLTLTKQALLINNSVRKASKSKKKKTVTSTQDIISANEQQKHQLDSILTIKDASSKKILEGESDFEISKKLPSYSVEKLLL